MYIYLFFNFRQMSRKIASDNFISQKTFHSILFVKYEYMYMLIDAAPGGAAAVRVASGVAVAERVAGRDVEDVEGVACWPDGVVAVDVAACDYDYYLVASVY